MHLQVAHLALLPGCVLCRHVSTVGEQLELMCHMLLMQVMEMHLKGEEPQRPVAFELLQRVYVHVDPEHFVPFEPDEISSTPL